MPTDRDSSVLPQAGLAATGIGLGGKALHDINKASRGLSAFDTARVDINARAPGLGRSIDALKQYSTHANAMLQSKILGMHIPKHTLSTFNPIATGKYKHLAERFLHGLKAEHVQWHSAPYALSDEGRLAYRNLTGREIGNVGKHIREPLNAVRQAREHYELFQHGTPEHGFKHLYDTLITELPSEHKAKLGNKVWEQINAKEIFSPGNYVSSLLKAAPDPEAKKILTDALHSAASKNMMGPTSAAADYVRIGRQHLIPGYRGIVGFGVGASLMPLMNRILNKRMDKHADDSSGFAQGTALTAGGLGASFKGLKHIISPVDVGVTWGEHPDFGGGHKGPGKALRDILVRQQSNKALPRYRLTEAVRGERNSINPAQATYLRGEQTGIRSVLGRKFDLLFDTGMGSGVPDWAHDPEVAGRSGMSRVLYNAQKPGARLGGHVAYVTDVPAFGTVMTGNSAGKGRATRGLGVAEMLRRNFASDKLKDTIVGYGPDKHVKSNPELITHRVSQTATPLTNQAAIDNIAKNVGKQQVLSELLTDPAANLSDKTRTLLSGLPNNGKRVLVVSGSLRGDAVALKALRLQKFLEKSRMTDKVQIVALLGNSATRTPYAAEALAHGNIATIGLVQSPKLFSRIPLIGDMHLGSTGTSSMYESLASPVPYMFSPHQGSEHLNNTRTRQGWRDYETRSLGLTNKGNHEAWDAGKLQRVVNSGLAKDTESAKHVVRGLGNIHLDEWNEGNKQLAGTLKGVHKGQAPRTIIHRLMSLTDKDKVDATLRARRMQKELAQSRDRFSTDVLSKVFQRARRLKTTRGLGMLGLGGTALGVGYHKFTRNNNTGA